MGRVTPTFFFLLFMATASASVGSSGMIRGLWYSGVELTGNNIMLVMVPSSFKELVSA